MKPGDHITKDNASQVQDLVSPGNYILVQQGMQMNIIPTSKLDWPPPFKDATEQYSSQVSLGADGTIKNYVAGQPFPLLDANDPQMASKVMWNYSFRPMYSDDLDLRFPEIASYIGNASATSSRSATTLSVTLPSTTISDESKFRRFRSIPTF